MSVESLRIVLVGCSQSGKTAFCRYLKERTFYQDLEPTHSESVYTYVLKNLYSANLCDQLCLETKPSSTALLDVDDSISSDSSLCKSFSATLQPNNAETVQSQFSAGEDANCLTSFHLESVYSKIKLEIMDTSGKSIQPSEYVLFSSYFVLFFNLCQVWTFDALQSWIKKIQSSSSSGHVPTFISLIGTHSDLPQAENFDKLESKLLADFLQCPYFEISTKTGYQLKPALTKLFQTLIHSNKSMNHKKNRTWIYENGSIDFVGLGSVSNNSNQPFNQPTSSLKCLNSDSLPTHQNLDSLFEGFAFINEKKHYLRLSEQQLLIFKPQPKYHLKSALNVLCFSHPDKIHPNYYLIDKIDLKSTKVTKKCQKTPILTFVKDDKTTYNIKFNDKSIMQQWLSKLSNTNCFPLIHTHNLDYAIQSWEELLKKNEASTLQLLRDCPSFSKYLSPFQLSSIEHSPHLNRLQINWNISSDHCLKKLYSIPENQFCADCGAKYPLHVSTNFGILICTPCNRIHRELGTRVNKTRPITGNFSWDSILVILVQALSNKFFNQMLEAKIPNQYSEKFTHRTLNQKLSLIPEWTQKNLNHSGSHSTESTCLESAYYTAKNKKRKQFIHSKYILREFMKDSQKQISAKKFHLSEEDQRNLILLASHPSRIQQLAQVIFCGISPDIICDDDGKTMLHIAAENGNSLAMLFLLENGANWLRKDINKLSALEHVLKMEEKIARWDTVFTNEINLDEKNLWSQKKVEKKIEALNLTPTENTNQKRMDSQKSSHVNLEVNNSYTHQSTGEYLHYSPQVYVNSYFTQNFEQVTRPVGEASNCFVHSILPAEVVHDSCVSESSLTSNLHRFDFDQDHRTFSNRELPKDGSKIPANMLSVRETSPEVSIYHPSLGTSSASLESFTKYPEASCEYQKKMERQNSIYSSIDANRRHQRGDQQSLGSSLEMKDRQDQYYEECISVSVVADSVAERQRGCISGTSPCDGWEKMCNQSFNGKVTSPDLCQDNGYNYEESIAPSGYTDSDATNISGRHLSFVQQWYEPTESAPGRDDDSDGSEPVLQRDIWTDLAMNRKGTFPVIGQHIEVKSSVSKEEETKSSRALFNIDKDTQNIDESSLQRPNLSLNRDSRQAEPETGSRSELKPNCIVLSYSLDYQEQVDENVDFSESNNSQPWNYEKLDRQNLSFAKNSSQRLSYPYIEKVESKGSNYQNCYQESRKEPIHMVPDQPAVHYSESYFSSTHDYQGKLKATTSRHPDSHESQICIEDTNRLGNSHQHLSVEIGVGCSVGDTSIVERPKSAVNLIYSSESDLIQCSTSFQHTDHSVLEYSEIIDSRFSYLPAPSQHTDHSTLEYSETIDSGYLPKSECAQVVDSNYASRSIAEYKNITGMSHLCKDQILRHGESFKDQTKNSIEIFAPQAQMKDPKIALSKQTHHPLDEVFHSPPQVFERKHSFHKQKKQSYPHATHLDVNCSQLVQNYNVRPQNQRQTCKSFEYLEHPSHSPHQVERTSRSHHRSPSFDESTSSPPKMFQESVYVVVEEPAHRHVSSPLNRTPEARTNSAKYIYTHDCPSPTKSVLVQPHTHMMMHHHDSSLFQRQPLSSKDCQHLILTDDQEVSPHWTPSPHRHPHSNNVSSRVRKLPCAYPQANQEDTKKSPIRVLKKN